MRQKDKDTTDRVQKDKEIERQNDKDRGQSYN